MPLHFFDQALYFVMAYLFVECIQKLLACSCTGECSAVIERSSKSTKIKIAFRSSIESYSDPVHQVDDIRFMMAHNFAKRLVC